MDIDTVLDAPGQRVCRALAEAGLFDEFYLAGGTGLALQLGHRRSADLDFFSRQAGERLSAVKIARAVRRRLGTRDARPVWRQVDQAAWDLAGTTVTFTAYPFPLLYPLVPGSRATPVLAGVFLAAPREIALMKAYAMGRRATFRDYLDLYFLLKREVITLEEIVNQAARKFVVGGETLFSVKLFLEQLVYTGDVEDKEASLRLVSGPGPTAGEVEELLREKAAGFLDRQARGGPPL